MVRLVGGGGGLEVAGLVGGGGGLELTGLVGGGVVFIPELNWLVGRGVLQNLLLRKKQNVLVTKKKIEISSPFSKYQDEDEKYLCLHKYNFVLHQGHDNDIFWWGGGIKISFPSLSTS